MPGNARLTFDLPPEVHARLKIAVKKRTSMREYCTGAIFRRLTEEEAVDYLTAEADPILAELWDNDDDSVYDNL